MERSKTWFVAMCFIVVGIVLLVNGWFFTGAMLLLLGCVLKLAD
jgi:drug/metabolite transporter (DMT)-like permease